MSERGFHHWPPAGVRMRHRSAEFRDGGLIHPFLLIHEAEVEVRCSKVRVQLDGLEKLFDGPVILARVEVMPSEVRVERQVEPIEIDCGQYGGERFFSPTNGRSVMRVIMLHGA